MADSPSQISTQLIQGFFSRYPQEAAEALHHLPIEEIQHQLSQASITEAAEVFMRLSPQIAAETIERMEDGFFAELFSKIDPMQGAALLARLDTGKVTDQLALLPQRIAKEYKELMAYPPDSAGHLMASNVFVFRKTDTAQLVLDQMRRGASRRIMNICVADQDRRLLGVVSLQDVALAQPDRQLGEIMRTNPLKIHAMAPREDVVKLMEGGRLTSLPVVDLEDKLLGIIRYEALVDVAKQSISGDLQTMFGAGRDERAMSKATFAVRKRLPWLEINLATAFLAAFVVGLFEDTISRITALAIFLPVVAGQSGNTGSQALAVTMRGLALREIRTQHWFRIVRKECSVGLINGCAVAATTSLVAYLWMQSLGLAVVIGVSMVVSMIVAGAAGAIIPIILKAVGQDPAQSSSIILTTVTDIVGFLSFLGLATMLAGYISPV
jgi:magnesium transporter